jgi:tetratricopeptide (TPR) repeat protein
MNINNYIENRDWDAAIAKYAIEIEDAKKTADKEKIAKAYMNSGYVRCFAPSKDENYDKAIEDFSIAIALTTDDKLKAECYVKRAYAYWLNSSMTKATGDCEQGVIDKHGEENVKTAAHELLGNIYSAKGESKEAFENYKKALKDNPVNFSLMDKYREAVKWLNDN